jgi:hypothetical protein
VVGGIFLLIGCIRAYLHNEIGWFALALAVGGASLMAAAFLAPEALAPVNRAWNKLGVLLHKITNPVILGAMFLFAIVPTGLVMRVFGKDPMARRMGRDQPYWVKRNTSGSTPDSLTQPF